MSNILNFCHRKCQENPSQKTKILERELASSDHAVFVFLNFHSPDDTNYYDDSVEDPGIRMQDVHYCTFASQTILANYWLISFAVSKCVDSS